MLAAWTISVIILAALLVWAINVIDKSLKVGDALNREVVRLTQANNILGTENDRLRAQIQALESSETHATVRLLNDRLAAMCEDLDDAHAEIEWWHTTFDAFSDRVATGPPRRETAEVEGD